MGSFIRHRRSSQLPQKFPFYGPVPAVSGMTRHRCAGNGVSISNIDFPTYGDQTQLHSGVKAAPFVEPD